jgi:hypothetical protein
VITILAFATLRMLIAIRRRNAGVFGDLELIIHTLKRCRGREALHSGGVMFIHDLARLESP